MKDFVITIRSGGKMESGYFRLKLDSSMNEMGSLEESRGSLWAILKAIISFLGDRDIVLASKTKILHEGKFTILSIARKDLYSYLGKDVADNLTDKEMNWIAEATHSNLPKHLDDALQEGLKSLGYEQIYVKKEHYLEGK